MKADLVIKSGEVITMDSAFQKVESIAAKGGRIIAVGSNKEIEDYIGAKTKVIEAKGKTVAPGFIDSHVHLMQTGLDMMKIDLTSCKSLRELKEAITKEVSKTEPGKWIMGTGYNEFDFQEKRCPTKQELDLVSPQNPIWLSRVDHHSGIVNSAAEKILRINKSIDGAEIDDKGETTGLLAGDANSHARLTLNKSLDNETRIDAVKKAAEKMLTVGITSVHALEGGSLFSDEDVDIILQEKHKLPIDIKVFHQTTEVKEVVKRGLKQIGGCLLIDGSIGSRTAAFIDSYVDAPGEHGILYFDDKELEQFVIEAHNNDLQITVHAIGDRALEQIITAYEKAQKQNFRNDHRHRIEHFSYPAPSHIKRCVDNNIILSVQPHWVRPCPLTTEVGPTRLGEERVSKGYPMASAYIEGAKMCGGSDSPISPIGPLLGIHGTVNHFRKEEAMSRLEVISLFTKDAAYAAFEEDIKGRLAPGLDADIVILDGDIFNTPDKKIKDMEVENAIVKGEILYSRK